MNRGPFEFSAEAAKDKGGPDGNTQLADLHGGHLDYGVYGAPQSINLAKVANDITGGRPSGGNDVEAAVLPKPLTGYTTQDRWSAEGSLLASIPSHIGPGIVESAREAWEHKGRTAFETVSGLALGSVFCLLTKNPRPIISAATTWAGRAFLGIAAVDMGGRFARPMSDTWAHPENLNMDKKVLGNNIGDAVVNYGLAVGGGIAGAKLGESYLATTKLGTFLQGYKETEVSAEALGKILAEPATAGEPLGVMARAFGRTTGGTADAPVTGPMRMREMPDGSHIGTTKDGNVMVLTRDGTALWFKNNRSAFGFKDKLELAKILHQGGDETDILTGMFSPTTSGSFRARGASSKAPFIGKDPASYFEAPGGGSEGAAAHGSAKPGSYITIDGTKIVTGPDGVLSSVETGGNRVFIDQKGKWHLGMAEASPSSAASPSRAFDFLHLDLSPAAFNLGGLTDRFRDLKKGAEVGLTESVLARMGDIGSGVLEHEVLIRSTGAQGGTGAAEGDNASKPSI